MKNFYVVALTLSAFVLLSACQSMQAQNGLAAKSGKNQTVLYFNPTVYPDIEEIKEHTNQAFFAAVDDKVAFSRNYRMLRSNTELSFDEVDVGLLKEYCKNNNAVFAMVPKVKFFKVGFGKYVFSNQVVVSLKLYDALGNLVAHSDYDTYKKKARILGSAENSIKIGTEGAMKLLSKNLRQAKVTPLSFIEPN